MTADEKRYTLAEAKLLIAKTECWNDGHYYQGIRQMNGRTPRVVCERCGASWITTEVDA